jgi:hypothetical protein
VGSEDRELRTEDGGSTRAAARISILYIPFSILCLFLIGCCPQKPPARQPYDGPTASLAEVVSTVNANNNRIKTLWASGDFEAWIRDDKGQSQHIDGDLLLASRKPTDLRMYGQGAGMRFFDVGSNSTQFWFYVPYEKIDTMWWGEYANIANLDSNAIPIRPDLLIEVLGVNDLAIDLLKQPIPAMRFDAMDDEYLVDFHTILSDRMIVQKEVAYDRKTLLPQHVTFFDPNGRVVLRADLSEHRPLGTESGAPKVATHYVIEFLQTHAKLVLKFAELKESNKGRPNDQTFRFPGPDVAAKTYKVDESPAQQSPTP